MARADLYAISGVGSLTPHHLPHRILTDAQLLGGVLNCPNLGVSLPHPLLEGRVGWVGAQRLPCLLEVPRHRGAVEAEACGDLRHRLSHLVQRYHLFHQLRTQVAVDPPRLGGRVLLRVLCCSGWMDRTCGFCRGARLVTLLSVRSAGHVYRTARILRQ